MKKHATLHFSLEELVYDPLFEYIERTVYYDREYIKFLLCSTCMILNVRKNKTKGRIIGDIFYVFTQTRMFLEQVRDYR